MIEIDFKDKYSEPICLALGFFDSIHIGHAEIIEECKRAALKRGAKAGIFTFSNNPFEFLGRPSKLVYDYQERLDKLKALGVDVVVKAQFDLGFMNSSKDDFLNTLTSAYNIKMIGCGEDYRFGKNHSGDVSYLGEFCDKNSIELVVVPTVLFNQKKAASSAIREALECGDLTLVNKILSHRYTIKGVVEHSAGNGHKLGYPTANVKATKNKALIKCGVYKSNVIFLGKSYPAITNVGARPTFLNQEFFIESHIIGFNGELYGQEIVIEFVEFLRDVKHFLNKEALKEQIKKDIELAYGKGESR